MERPCQVKIEVLEKDETNIRLVIKEADVPLMNALRRIALAEVPSMAIDEVVMIENSSILQDETIAHRLGLTPLKTDLDNYNLPEECECKSEFGCSLCRVSHFFGRRPNEARPSLNMPRKNSISKQSTGFRPKGAV